LALNYAVLRRDELVLRRAGELVLQPPQAQQDDDRQDRARDQRGDQEKEAEHEHGDEEHPIKDALQRAAPAAVELDLHARPPQDSELRFRMMTPPDFSSCSSERSLRASASSSSLPKVRKP